MSNAPFHRQHRHDRLRTWTKCAQAISELRFQRDLGELSWPHPEPELKALKALVQQRVALIGKHDIDTLADLAALLIVEGMVAQHLRDLRLAALRQSPFSREYAP